MSFSQPDVPRKVRRDPPDRDALPVPAIEGTLAPPSATPPLSSAAPTSSHFDPLPVPAMETLDPPCAAPLLSSAAPTPHFHSDLTLKPSRIIKIRFPKRDILPAAEGTIPPPSAAPPLPSAALPHSCAAPTLPSPAPSPRRSARTAAGAGAMVQGADGGAKPLPSSLAGAGGRSSHLEDGLKHITERNSTIKYSALRSQTGDVKKDMIDFKLRKVFMKCDKIRSDKVGKAEANFARALQNIDAEHTSNLIAAICESICAPEVAVVYHEKMLEHVPPEGSDPWEKPERLSTIMDMLRKLKIIDSKR